jgi:hypothetical protein
MAARGYAANGENTYPLIHWLSVAPPVFHCVLPRAATAKLLNAPHSITLIICEGETEQEYFEAARIHYHLTRP